MGRDIGGGYPVTEEFTRPFGRGQQQVEYAFAFGDVGRALSRAVAGLERRAPVVGVLHNLRNVAAAAGAVIIDRNIIAAISRRGQAVAYRHRAGSAIHGHDDGRENGGAVKRDVYPLALFHFGHAAQFQRRRAYLDAVARRGVSRDVGRELHHIGRRAGRVDGRNTRHMPRAIIRIAHADTQLIPHANARYGG